MVGDTYLARLRTITTCDSILKGLDCVSNGRGWAQSQGRLAGGKDVCFSTGGWFSSHHRGEDIAEPEAFYLPSDSFESPIPDYPGLTNPSNPFGGDPWHSCSSGTLHIELSITEHLYLGVQPPAEPKLLSTIDSPGLLGASACPGSWDHAQCGLAFLVQIAIRF